MAEIPRDVIISQTAKDTDYVFSSVYSGERDAFLGLDVTVSNESGSQAFFFIILNLKLSYFAHRNTFIFTIFSSNIETLKYFVSKS